MAAAAREQLHLQLRRDFGNEMRGGRALTSASNLSEITVLLISNVSGGLRYSLVLLRLNAVECVCVFMIKVVISGQCLS